MKSWIYKCNSTSQSNGPFSGNWEKVFGPDVEIRWGPRSLKGAESVQIGDTFIACQTNRHSLVGVEAVRRRMLTFAKSFGKYLGSIEFRMEVYPGY